MLFGRAVVDDDMAAGIGQFQGGGTSNATGAEPEDNPVSIEDFAHTVYHLMGIDAGKELMAPGARPIEIVANGNVIKEILA